MEKHTINFLDAAGSIIKVYTGYFLNYISVQFFAEGILNSNEKIVDYVIL